MDKSVVDLIESIEFSIRKLAELTNEDYIDACLVNNAFMLNGSLKDGKLELDYYRKIKTEANNE
jgi:hypothetical protein